MNVYDLLGVGRDADIDDIKHAYRRLAKQLHPDINAGDAAATERFKLITAAYNLLADRRRRAEYDGGRKAGGGGGAPKPWEKGGAWFDFEIDEITGERLADLFGDVAGKRLGRVQGGRATSLWVGGQDIAETVEVTETEARDGVCKLVTTMAGLSVAVDIPPGAANGKVVTVRGFGIEGFGGAPPGDLNVIVRIIPDPAIEARR